MAKRVVPAWLILLVFGVFSLWHQTAAASWSSNWIWQSENGPANTWMAFRKTFDLSSAPASAFANIAVDSKYWLWINGEMVVFEGGLKRGPNPTDTYYDSVNVTPYLRTGSNTIAILVWYFGKNGNSSFDSGKGGLVFEGHFGGTLLGSDATWKMKVHPAYERITADPQPNGAYAESNVRFNAQNNTIDGWTQPSYDDVGWSTAVIKGIPPVAPWNNLWKRPIPLWKDFGLKDYEALSVTLPFTAATQTVIRARLPYNAQITAWLKVNATAGKVIDMRTDAYQDGGNIAPSDQRFGLRAEYVTRAGEQEFEELAWTSGHEVRYTIPAGVTVLGLKYRETGYNSEFSGSFDCDDSYLDKLWEKARRTVYVNMRDNFMDCPTRERCQWWGDIVISIGEAFYCLDRKSDDLISKGISQLIEYRKNGTVLHSPIPAVYQGELPQQMLASIGEFGFWYYYLYSGDSASMAYAYPHVKNYLQLWTMDSDGLVNHRGGEWDWGDWGNNIDMRVMENAWYYMALTAAIKMANLTGNSIDIGWFTDRKTSIENNYNRVLWSGTAYRSPAYNDQTDDRGHALAVLAGLADSTKWEEIRTVFQTNLHSSPYMEKYVLEALYQMRFPEDAISRMKARYNAMVNHPTITTLWEFWDLPGQGTYNHEWAGGPLTLLSQYGAGVAPESVAFGTYHVLPQMGTLRNISMTVPSAKGLIGVDLAKHADRFTLDLVSPQGSKAIVGIPRKGCTINVISVNGTEVWREGSFVGDVTGIASNGADNRYVKFLVDPGTWKFSASLTWTDPFTSENLALNRPVSASTTLENADWGINRVTDGITTSVAQAKGYTSNPPVASAGNAEWIEVDLESNKLFDKVVLHPRTDIANVNNGSPNFPVDFTIQVKSEGGSYTTVKTITGQADPAGVAQTYSFSPATARYVRIAVSRLGLPASDEAASYRLQLAEMEIYNSSITHIRAGNRSLGQRALRLSFPNHKGPVLNISVPGDYTLRIVNATGRVLGEYHGRGTGSIPLSRNSLSKGVYFAHLLASGMRVTKKMVLF